MTKRILILIAAGLVLGVPAKCQETAPLKLVRTFRLPADVKGHFDHFAVDLKHERLYATPEDYKAVLVLNVKTGKLLHIIRGIEKPHAILYREDLNRLYVTDGEAGALRIIDNATYRIISSVKLLVDADPIVYDPATKYLYVVNGGGDAHMTYSTISVVNTTTGKKVGQMKVDGDTLESMRIETSSPRLYVNNKAKNQVEVVDRDKRVIIASWPVTKGKVNVAMAFDQPHHRLFIGCRSGAIVVFDTETGKEVTALPITKGVDDMVFDPASKHLYASGDGDADVYEQVDADNYKLLGKVPTGPLGKTAILVPQLHEYFVAVPQHGTVNAEVLVFAVQ